MAPFWSDTRGEDLSGNIRRCRRVTAMVSVGASAAGHGQQWRQVGEPSTEPPKSWTPCRTAVRAETTWSPSTSSGPDPARPGRPRSVDGPVRVSRHDEDDED